MYKSKDGKFIIQRVFDSVLNAIRITGTVTGIFTPSGLNIGMRTTTMNVGDVAVKIPSTVYPSRNTISIINLSLTDDIYIGDSNAVEAHDNLGTTGGWPILSEEGFDTDIASGIDIWAIAKAGKTVKIKVLEIA